MLTKHVFSPRITLAMTPEFKPKPSSHSGVASSLLLPSSSSREHISTATRVRFGKVIRGTDSAGRFISALALGGLHSSESVHRLAMTHTTAQRSSTALPREAEDSPSRKFAG